MAIEKGQQFESVTIPASEIRVGDRLSHRARVHRVREYNGTILAATKVQGAKSGGLSQFHPDEQVTVWRKP